MKCKPGRRVVTDGTECRSFTTGITGFCGSGKCMPTTSTTTKTTTTTVVPTQFPRISSSLLPKVGEWAISGTLTLSSLNVDEYTFLRETQLHADVINTLTRLMDRATGDSPVRVSLTDVKTPAARQRRASGAKKDIDVGYNIIAKALSGTQETALTQALGSHEEFNVLLFVSMLKYSELQSTKATVQTPFTKNVALAVTEASASAGDDSEASVTPIVIGVIVVVLIIAAIVLLLKKKSADTGSKSDHQTYVNPAFDKESGIVGGNVAVEPSMTITDRTRRKSMRTEQIQSTLEETKDMEASNNFTNARSEATESKNRFQDILPYNHNRVVLESLPGVAGSDYINASHVDGYTKDDSYILTQGPLKATVADFFRMVWQEDAGVVVMLTAAEHNGRELSFQYWPDSMHVRETFGEWHVSMTHREIESYYVQRTLQLTNNKATGETRTIEQFQFLQWSGSETPSSAGQLLQFRKEILNAQDESELDGPMIVHDGNGASQAGAFVCIDRELKRFDQEGEVDVFETVVDLRKGRSYTVLEAAQYSFIHQAIIEHVEREPAKPAEGVPDTVAQFLKSVVIPEQYSNFDFGTNGRKIVRMGQFAMLLRSRGEQITRPVAVAVCSDVIVIAAPTNNGVYEISATPVSRAALKVIDAQHEWDEPIMCLQSGSVKIVLEASSDEEKEEWIAFLNERSEFVSTQELRGPRLIPLKPSSREEISNLLGLLDPAKPEARQELEAEWAVIPKVTLEKTYMEENVAQPGAQAFAAYEDPVGQTGAYNEAQGGYLQVGEDGGDTPTSAPVDADNFGAALAGLNNTVYDEPPVQTGGPAVVNETNSGAPIYNAHVISNGAISPNPDTEVVQQKETAPIFAMLAKKKRSASNLAPSPAATSLPLSAPVASFNTAYAQPAQSNLAETNLDAQASAILQLGAGLGATDTAKTRELPDDPLERRLSKAVESIGLLGNNRPAAESWQTQSVGDKLRERKIARQTSQQSLNGGALGGGVQVQCSFLGNCKCPNCA